MPCIATAWPRYHSNVTSLVEADGVRLRDQRCRVESLAFRLRRFGQLPVGRIDSELVLQLLFMIDELFDLALDDGVEGPPGCVCCCE